MGSCSCKNRALNTVVPKNKRLVHTTTLTLNNRLLIKGVLSPSPEALGQEKQTNNKSNHLIGLSQTSTIGLGASCRCGTVNNNQDDFILIADPSFTLAGVFDGHGKFGDKVSDYVKTILPKLIISVREEEENEEKEEEQIFNAFLETNRRLIRRSTNRTVNFNSNKSGSTATIAYILGRYLYVANVGNSRAILGIKNGPKYVSYRVTNDHRPNLLDEETRINKAGGEIRSYLNENIPRVFAKDSEEPGIALSRVIGDTHAQSLGVIAEPDVFKIEITNELEYLVICSDGVWDMFSDEEVIALISPLGNKCKLAADTVTLNAQKRWTLTRKGWIDDMTALIVYLPWQMSDN